MPCRGLGHPVLRSSRCGGSDYGLGMGRVAFDRASGSGHARPGPVRSNGAPARSGEQWLERTVEGLEGADDPEDDRGGEVEKMSSSGPNVVRTNSTTGLSLPATQVVSFSSDRNTDIASSSPRTITDANQRIKNLRCADLRLPLRVAGRVSRAPARQIQNVPTRRLQLRFVGSLQVMAWAILGTRVARHSPALAQQCTGARRSEIRPVPADIRKTTPPQPVLGHPLQESEGATSPRANCGNPCRKN